MMTDSTSQSLNPSNDDDLNARMANLERESYMVKQQLEESQQRIEGFIKENASLKEAVQVSEKAAFDKNDLYLRVDKERETLINERSELQEHVSDYKNKKIRAESDLERVLNDKRNLLDELTTIRSDVKKLRDENTVLQTYFDQFQQDKTLLDSERNRWNVEKDLFIKNKEWCMREIGERDQSISQLRLQILNIERNSIDEKNRVVEENRKLNIQTESLAAAVSMYEEEANKLRARVDSLVQERESAISSLKDELYAKETLVLTYQERIHSLEEDVTGLKNDEKELKNALKDKEAALEILHIEAKQVAEESSNQLGERDLKIMRLQDELDKANELLQYSGGRMGLSATADLSSISPSAAAAAELVSSGLSLTSMYAKHCKVISDLHEERNSRKQLEEYINEMVEDFRKKAPNVIQLRNEYEIAVTENEELHRRLKEYYGDRDSLRNEKINLERELSFTKGDYLAVQRANVELKKQVQRLLFHLNHADDDLDRSVVDDTSSFTTISQLHEKYMGSLSTIEELKTSHDEIVLKARQDAAEELHPQFEKFTREIEDLQLLQNRTKATIAELERENNDLREELEKLRTDTPMNRSKMYDSDVVDEWKSKFESAQSKLDYIIQEKKIVEQTLNSRSEHLNNLIGELKSSNARLESNVELQKKNHEMAIKKVTEYEKEVMKKAEETIKYKVTVDSLESRINGLTQQFNESLNDVARLKLSLHNANEELMRAQSDANHWKAEVSVLKESGVNASRMTTALSSFETILRSHEDNSFGKVKAQLDSTTTERDELKQLVDELRVHTESQTDTVRLRGLELERAQTKCAEFEAALNRLNAEKADLQNRLAAASVPVGSVDNLTKELQQARNKNSYLEKQLYARQLELDGVNNKLVTKENELEDMKAFSNNLETSLLKSRAEAQKPVGEAIAGAPAAVSTFATDDAAFAELQQKFGKLNEEHEDNKQKMNKLRALARQYRDDGKANEEKVASLTAENERLKSEMSKIESDIKTAGGAPVAVLTLRKNLSARLAEVATLKKERDELTKQIEIATRERAELEVRIKKLEEKEVENTSRINTLNSMYSKSRETQLKLRQELDASKEEKNGLKAENETLRQQSTLQQSFSEDNSRKRSQPETTESPSTSNIQGKRPRIVFNPTADQPASPVVNKPDLELEPMVDEEDEEEEGEILNLQDEEDAIEEDEAANGNEEEPVSNENADKVPSMEYNPVEDYQVEHHEEPVDDEMVDAVPGDVNFGAPNYGEHEQMDYDVGQEGDSYSEPPQLFNEPDPHPDEQDNEGLPYLNEGGEEEYYEDDEDNDNVEDDDEDDIDVHSNEPSEGEDFGQGPGDEDDDDDDVVILE